MPWIDRKTWSNVYLLPFNPVIRSLILADMFISGGFGLIAPIIAVFWTDHLSISLTAVGFAEAIYLLTRSLGQIPAADIIDRLKGERDDYFALIVGGIVNVLVPLGYIFINAPWQLFVLQFFAGIGDALVFPSWYAIFTRHLDKGKVGTEWGVYNTLTGLMGAVVAGLGSFLAAQFGFQVVFLIVSVACLIGLIFQLGMRKHFITQHPVQRKLHPKLS